jgi:hypothetical protein
LATFSRFTYSRRHRGRDDERREDGRDDECQAIGYADHYKSPCREIVTSAALPQKGPKALGGAPVRSVRFNDGDAKAMAHRMRAFST